MDRLSLSSLAGHAICWVAVAAGAVSTALSPLLAFGDALWAIPLLIVMLPTMFLLLIGVIIAAGNNDGPHSSMRRAAIALLIVGMASSILAFVVVGSWVPVQD